MRSVRFVALIFACFFNSGARAFYISDTFFKLIAGADAVVHGKITSVDEDLFNFEVKDIVFGELQEKTIQVRKFQDWPCAARWTKYAVDQEALLFLRKVIEPDGSRVTWRVLSPGNEGEMPVADGFEYSRIRTTDRGDGRKTYEISGEKIFADQQRVDILVAAVRGLRERFNLEWDRQRHRVISISRLCDAESLDRYRKENEVQSFLVREVERAEERIRRGY